MTEIFVIFSIATIIVALLGFSSALQLVGVGNDLSKWTYRCPAAPLNRAAA